MTAPFRDNQPSIQAALDEAERMRAVDAIAAGKKREQWLRAVDAEAVAKRREAWKFGCTVALVYGGALLVALIALAIWIASA